MFDLPFVLLHVSLILIVSMFVFIIRMKNKQQIHYAIIGTIVTMTIWDLGCLLEVYFNNSRLLFVNTSFVGIILSPVSIFLMGKIFVTTKINFDWKYKSLFIIPVFSMFMLFTNEYHHLFIKKYSILSLEFVGGSYYWFHSIYSYALIFLGLWHLLSFTIKNAGFFSRQSLLIIVGVVIPLTTNISFVFKIVSFSRHLIPVAFSFSILCFALAIFKYDFLNVVPIALQKVVDHISDSFVVIDENYNIIDFNKTFYKNFKELIKIKRSVNLFNEIANNTNAGIDKDAFADIIKRSKEEKKTITLEQTIHYPNYEKTFDIDITPIFNHDRNVGTIILFKDITAINNAHKQLVEQEKFSSLGQLIGGIAHDMNSRLYALDGQIYLLEKYANEIKNNETLDREDYISIAEDILKQIENMKLAEGSMSKTIDSVRNHTRNYAVDNDSEFGMYKVIETIETLLGQKFQRHNCQMIYKQNKKEDILIRGDFSKFESVLINIISNAVEAYNINGEKTGGLVEIYTEEKDNEIIISVKDYGKGIPEIIRNDIFKEVLTTKGVNGTGMGLYFSRSIIVGSFKGDIWFETESGKGTTFYVKVPRG